MTATTKDLLTALAVGACFLVIAVLVGLQLPTLVLFPVAAFLLFWGAQTWRRRH
ncbi:MULTISPECIES: hypothetical protein [unclassified Rathayibacter]|uniref:hypothetical protein n=1 Tax=unclassified Rathayibacter TaxID=2609250 RepID=UPI00131FED60|nr:MULTISPECIES: hypothetical protein [unclassified Rathayibacter]QHC69114.1 hypothetical protein GSU45_01080 [Rathayibacter sp. VKM Ac-2801]